MTWAEPLTQALLSKNNKSKHRALPPCQLVLKTSLLLSPQQCQEVGIISFPLKK